MNITVHSNDITQVTLYKHTESAFTWLINVAVIVKQSISISVSLETPGFRFCCNVFFFSFSPACFSPPLTPVVVKFLSFS